MRILKHDGDPISPQYLKASNASAQPAFADTAKQFAAALNLPTDYAVFLAGQLPDDLRSDNYARDKVQAAFHAFCRSLRCDGSPR